VLPRSASLSPSRVPGAEARVQWRHREALRARVSSQREVVTSLTPERASWSYSQHPSALMRAHPATLLVLACSCLVLLLLLLLLLLVVV